MSHLVETMAYAGETPWHGLGYSVSNDLTPDEMMVAAKVDWEVSKSPAVVQINGEYVDSGKSALIRSSDNKILDVISNDWNPTQNRDAFDFFKQYTDEGHMNMETAGSLDGGRNVWALAKINQSFRILKDDIIEGYLLFSNPHQYGRAINVRFTPIRVVCNNTLTLAINSASKASVSVNHRKVFAPSEVATSLGIASQQMKMYEARANFLSQKSFTQAQLTEYLKKVFPIVSGESNELSRPASTVMEIMESQPGAEFGRGSFWQAFNGVTYATDHLLGRSADSRLKSAWFGINQNRKIVAMQTALEMAG